MSFPTSGIQAYWKLDESSGNAADATGNGNTGVNTSVTYGAGALNNCGIFNGSALLDCGSSSTLANNVTGYSVSAWLQIADHTQTQFYIADWGTTPSGNENFAIWTNGGADFGTRFSDSAGTYYTSNSGVTPTNNTWYHVVATYNGISLIIYVNGTAHSQAVTAVPHVGGDFQIGARGNSSLNLNGKIDEVGVWNRALSSTEVTTLYNSGTPLAYPSAVANSAFLNFM